MSVIQMIYESIETDDYDQSERLVDKFNSASPEEKEIINDVLLTICGYSMPTLIEMAGDYIWRSKHDSE